MGEFLLNNPVYAPFVCKYIKGNAENNIEFDELKDVKKGASLAAETVSSGEKVLSVFTKVPVVTSAVSLVSALVTGPMSSPACRSSRLSRGEKTPPFSEEDRKKAMEQGLKLASPQLHKFYKFQDSCEKSSSFLQEQRAKSK